MKFNSARIDYLLERRFRKNSSRTSFDFKSIDPERPRTETKISRSLLRVQNNTNLSPEKSLKDLHDESSSSSFSDTDEPLITDKDTIAARFNDDDYLERLAEWTSNESSSALFDETISNSSDDHPLESSMTDGHVDDLQITYENIPMKNECLPQLDGHVDFCWTKSTKNSCARRVSKGKIQKIPKLHLNAFANDVKRKSSVKTLDSYFQIRTMPKFRKSKKVKADFDDCIVIGDDSNDVEMKDVEEIQPK